MKKYSDLYKTKKRWYEEALQRYQQGNPDEVEIINVRKRFYKAEAKVGSKAGTKTGAKSPRSKYHLSLREKLCKVTGKDWKNFHSIISGKWERIKEDPAKLIAYNKHEQSRWGMK